MAQLTILYDGGCPLCLREVRFLRGRDPRGDRLGFVDIDASDYDPRGHGGIDYREAMARIHGITADGQVLRDVEVFARAYGLVGLGWLYAPSRWDPPSMASTGSGPGPACSSPVAPTSIRSAGPAPTPPPAHEGPGAERPAPAWLEKMPWPGRKRWLATG
jgi:predicted DCC family thiol-disulfide oxidoreductase YuxK